jgi:RNA polymerase sigma factor (sigma-70 family)
VDDNRLWRLAQAGDRDAFAALFELHGNAVYRFCYRSTVDWSVAEDLTAAVFLEAWRKLREVELGPYGALPWLLGVATNVVRNQRRALRRYRAALKRIPPLRPEADFAGDLDARIDAAQQMLRLRPQIDALPRPEREVLALLWEGLSIQEIASALSLPEPTVRTRIYRLRQRFRRVGAVDARGEFKSPEGVSLP